MTALCWPLFVLAVARREKRCELDPPGIISATPRANQHRQAQCVVFRNGVLPLAALAAAQRAPPKASDEQIINGDKPISRHADTS